MSLFSLQRNPKGDTCNKQRQDCYDGRNPSRHCRGARGLRRDSFMSQRSLSIFLSCQVRRVIAVRKPLNRSCSLMALSAVATRTQTGPHFGLANLIKFLEIGVLHG